MRIGPGEVRERHGEIEYRVHVDCPGLPDSLWYSIGSKFANLLTDSCDAPLLALLIPAMARGEDIHLDGGVSEKLYYSLSGPYQRLLQHVIPSLRTIRIHPRDRLCTAHSATGVATGFSGGIDSFCVLADHYYSDFGFKVTHLLFNNVGSHGSGEQGELLFEKRHARTAAVAERVGLPLVKINSNVDAFYSGALTFKQTHAPRNASVALLIQGGIRRFLYASSFAYRQVFVGPADGIAHIDTIALPLLSTDSLDICSAGSQYTRVDKTLRVAQIEDSHDTLDVCTNSTDLGNCSACDKCLRALLTLEAAGLLQRYATSFDLELYRRKRDYFIGQALRSSDPFLREIIEFAWGRNFSFPLSSRLSGLPEPLKLPLRLARSAARAVRARLAIRPEGSG